MASSYLGNQPSNNFVSLKRQVITGNGGASYTLDHSVASVNDVAIFVNNVRQDPASYSISGTALTLGGTISSSDSCYVIFLGQALQTVTPATGTVTGDMLTKPFNYDSGTLYLDDTNNRVGIGTTSPDNPLHVVGDSTFEHRTNVEFKIQDATDAGGGTRLSSIWKASGSDVEIGNVEIDLTDGTTGSEDSQILFKTINNGTLGEKMRIASDGTLVVGSSSTTIPANATSGTYATVGGGFPLQSTNNNICAIFNRHSSTGVLIEIKYNGSVKGSISTNGSTTAYNTSSDYRLKENIADITDATTRVKQLQPKRFNFIENANTTVDGFIAHEVSSIIPEAVTGEKDAVDENGDIAPQGIDQSKLVPVLTKALQEAITKIEELETRIQTLENN